MIEFEKEFTRTRGQPFEINGRVYRMIYVLSDASPTEFVLKFEHAVRNPQQGLRLDCDAPLEINGYRDKAFVLWHGTVPERIIVRRTGPEKVTIRNVWDHGDGVVHSWHAGGAIIAESVTGNDILLYCNSTLDNSDCRDLIIRLTPGMNPSRH